MKVTINLDNMDPVHKLPGSTSAFMFEFLKYADSEGIITLSPIRKEAVQTKFGFTHYMTEKALKQCIQEEVFTKVCRGVYKINPNIFTIE